MADISINKIKDRVETRVNALARKKEFASSLLKIVLAILFIPFTILQIFGFPEVPTFNLLIYIIVVWLILAFIFFVLNILSSLTYIYLIDRSIDYHSYAVEHIEDQISFIDKLKSWEEFKKKIENSPQATSLQEKILQFQAEDIEHASNRLDERNKFADHSVTFWFEIVEVVGVYLLFALGLLMYLYSVIFIIAINVLI